jgi:CIC family chloride channel protein
MFAPTLFIGAMLGGAVSTVERLFFPNLTGSVGTYSLVGMGVLFAGFLRAPITSVFMALEVSGDYSIILPVLVANMLSYLIARKLQRVPILEVITRQDGLHLPALEEEREHESLLVEDAMREPKLPPFEGKETVGSARAIAGTQPDGKFLVMRNERRWSLVSSEELERFANEGKEEQTLNAVLPDRAVPYLYPDQDLDVALGYAQEWTLIPVVSRTNNMRIQGVLELTDVLHAYRHSHSENGHL